MRDVGIVVAMVVGAGCGGGKAVTATAPTVRPPATTAPTTIVPAPVPPALLADQIGQPFGPVTLPAVPRFALPVVAPGSQSLRELRVRGAARFATLVQVEGYVTWIYDCVAAVQAKTKQSRKLVIRSIERDPTQCRRPTFHLGETADEEPTRGLWVVDVPRHPTKAERKAFDRATLDAWPEVPVLHVGDRVIVRGRFDGASPHGDADSDGLIVYGGVEHVARDAPSATAEVVLAPSPSTAATPGPPTADAADPALGAACAQAMTHGVTQEIVDACGRASAADPHQAAYQLMTGFGFYQRATAAGGHTDADFAPARARLELAVQLEPRLWRAHLFLGRIHRTLEHDLDAALAFQAAIQADPTRIDAYIALVVLYHHWGYADEALAVARVGLTNTTGKRRAALAYEQTLILHDRGEAAAAQRALDDALAFDPDFLPARFEHGARAFDRGDLTTAKADFERYLAAHPDADGRTMAQRYLDRIAGAP